MNTPLIIVILYVAFLLGLGIFMSKKEKKDGENFLLYKGKNGTWITAVTIAGLAIGGASTIGIAQNAFVAGLSAGWYNVAWAFGAIVASFLVVKRFRNSGHNTVTGLVQDYNSYDFNSMYNNCTSIYSWWFNFSKFITRYI